MPLSASEDRERLKAWVVGLTMACPFDQSNPHDCPLCQIRIKPLIERLHWVDSLEHEQLRLIVTTHLLCLAQKQS
jgi:hypothetical protein